jgi:hypothetical protein
MSGCFHGEFISAVNTKRINCKLKEYALFYVPKKLAEKIKPAGSGSVKEITNKAEKRKKEEFHTFLLQQFLQLVLI